MTVTVTCRCGATIRTESVDESIRLTLEHDKACTAKKEQAR